MHNKRECYIMLNLISDRFQFVSISRSFGEKIEVSYLANFIKK